jgi:Mg-chelatase subunit ChlI
MPVIYPFTAVVGQERMRRALVLNAVDPRIGGVLIRGERGTAKSTAARALAALLPNVRVVTDCRFGCDPSVPEVGAPNAGNELPTAKNCRSARAPLPSSTCPFLQPKIGL